MIRIKYLIQLIYSCTSKRNMESISMFDGMLSNGAHVSLVSGDLLAT